GHGKDGPDGERVWALFCSGCVTEYDTFTMQEGEEVPCAECGRMVAAGHLRVRLLDSQTTYKGVCPACAERADQGGKTLLSTFLIAGAFLVGAGVVLWLMKCSPPRRDARAAAVPPSSAETPRRTIALVP